MSPYFSKRAIFHRETLIHDKIDRLFERFEQMGERSGKRQNIVDLDAAFAALTADIITHCFYGEDFDYLGNESFRFDVRDAILGLIGYYHLTRFFPFLASSLKKLPIPILRFLQPGAASLLTSQADIRRKIQRRLQVEKEASEDQRPSDAVIVEALKDPTIPPAEKAIERLGDEGTNVIYAGMETTARALSTMMFPLLNDKTKLRRSQKDLAEVQPSEPSKRYTSAQLEGLPYLVSSG